MQEEWQKQRKELREKRTALAKAIAKALGGTLETYKDADAFDEMRYQKVTLEGRTIGLYFDHDRIEVSGAWPMERDTLGAMRTMRPRDLGVINYNEEEPRIGCSASKGAEAIAKDIKRRFLPAFTRIYDACVERIAKNEEHGNIALKAARELCKRFGSLKDLKGEGQAASFWHSETGAVTVNAWNDGRVSVAFAHRLTGLTIEQAEQILRVLQKGGE
jgi:hypothetical protein